MLIEADHFPGWCPHPEVGTMPNGWRAIPVDSSLFVTTMERMEMQYHLEEVRRIDETARRRKKNVRTNCR